MKQNIGDIAVLGIECILQPNHSIKSNRQEDTNAGIHSHAGAWERGGWCFVWE